MIQRLHSACSFVPFGSPAILKYQKTSAFLLKIVGCGSLNSHAAVVLVNLAVITKYQGLGSLNNVYFSLFWRPEVSDQGADKVRSESLPP